MEQPDIIIAKLKEIHSPESMESTRHVEGFSLARKLVYILPAYVDHPEYIRWKKESNMYRRKYKIPDF